jgi:hypothetical protein
MVLSGLEKHVHDSGSTLATPFFSALITSFTSSTAGASTTTNAFFGFAAVLTGP